MVEFNINELRLFRLFNNSLERGLRHINTWTDLSEESIARNETNLKETMRDQIERERHRGVFDAVIR